MACCLFDTISTDKLLISPLRANYNEISLQKYINLHLEKKKKKRLQNGGHFLCVNSLSAGLLCVPYVYGTQTCRLSLWLQIF